MKNWRDWIGLVADQLGLLVVLAGLIGYFGWRADHFLTVTNFTTMANQIPALVLASVGMTYILVIGGIDLSVGSILGLASATVGVMMTGANPSSLFVAVLAALALGIACGLFNGLVTVAWSIPSFIVTLGMLEMARGLTHRITHSQSMYIGSKVGGIAGTTLGGMSLPFWIAMAAVVVGQFVLSRTVFGRYMIAIGTNEEAVRLSGIATRPVKVAVFVIAAMLAAAGGIIDVSRAEAANPNSGTGLELTVIAAVVIGGTSLLGGRGSVVSSLLGVAIIAVLSRGLAAQGVNDEIKRMITGGVIVLAAILDYYRHRFAARGG